MTSYRNLLRLRDIDESLRIVTGHLDRGPLEDPLVFDAVRIRLIEIGEAVKDLTPDITEPRPDIPWRSIARTRDHLVHRYFETSTEIARSVVTQGLPPLREAVTCSPDTARRSAGTTPARTTPPREAYRVVADPSCGVIPLNSPRAGRQQG